MAGSSRLQVTLPNGVSLDLPSATDAFPLDRVFCSEFPGYGARPEDTRCIHCGREENHQHRLYPFRCHRPCFLCRSNSHWGKACPVMVQNLSRWWWRTRGLAYDLPGLSMAPPATAKNCSVDDLMTAPPSFMIDALRRRSSLSREKIHNFEATLKNAQQMAEASNMILRHTGGLIHELPDAQLVHGVLERVAELASLSNTISDSAQALLRQLMNQLKHDVRTHLSFQKPVSRQFRLADQHNLTLNCYGKRPNGDSVAIHITGPGPSSISLPNDLQNVHPSRWNAPSFRQEKNEMPIFEGDQFHSNKRIKIERDETPPLSATRNFQAPLRADRTTSAVLAGNHEGVPRLSKPLTSAYSMNCEVGAEASNTATVWPLNGVNRSRLGADGLGSAAFEQNRDPASSKPWDNTTPNTHALTSGSGYSYAAEGGNASELNVRQRNSAIDQLIEEQRGKLQHGHHPLNQTGLRPAHAPDWRGHLAPTPCAKSHSRLESHIWTESQGSEALDYGRLTPPALQSSEGNMQSTAITGNSTGEGEHGL